MIKGHRRINILVMDLSLLANQYFFIFFQIISTAKLISSGSSGLTNVTLVEGTSGSIHSTNFPMDYPPLRTQTTHILGPKGTKLRLRFQASYLIPNYLSYLDYATKGHLISKELFGVIILTKKPTKIFKGFCFSL